VVLVFVVMQKHMVAMVPSLFLAMGVIVVVLVYMFSTNLMVVQRSKASLLSFCKTQADS
jgi:hypothetical protein